MFSTVSALVQVIVLCTVISNVSQSCRVSLVTCGEYYDCTCHISSLFVSSSAKNII